MVFIVVKVGIEIANRVYGTKSTDKSGTFAAK
jgi:hypothetical protein